MHIVSKTSVQADRLSMPPEPVVWTDRLSVRYRIPKEKVSGLKEFAIRWAQGRLEYETFWALKDLNLQVYPGELFGIVGRNGAGKSTLLKVVAGLLHPEQGRVIVRGRVAPLLDLSAGFHPELTGRENVFLYGTLLGLSRDQIDELFEAIVEFAELWDFIDAPLRTYSTGMTARLGFAVATCHFAEVLLVDEVLAVGDAQFQEKCLVRMDEFRQQGATILFVTHSLEQAKAICDRVTWLDQGRVRSMGEAVEVIDHYIASFSSS